MTWRYRAYGLDIDSEFAIPGLQSGIRSSEPGLLITDGPAPTGHPQDPDGAVVARVVVPPFVDYVFVRRPDGGYTMRYRDAVDFDIDKNLSTVTVRVVPDTAAQPMRNADLAEMLLVGSVPSFILSMKGDLVLHASAIAHEDAVIAFVGRSGQGKSTMAALMCAAGHPLVSDDVLRLAAVDSGYRCSLGSEGLRLRKLADEIAERFAVAPVQNGSKDGRTLLEPAGLAKDGLPLTAIVIPFPTRERESLELRQLPAADAGLMLLSYPRLLGWEDAEVLSRQFEQTMALSEQVPVFTAQVPWGPPFAEDLPADLVRQLFGAL